MTSRLESILNDPLFRREAEQAGLTRRQMAALERGAPVMRAAEFGGPAEGAPPVLEAIVLLQGRPSAVAQEPLRGSSLGHGADLLARTAIRSKRPSIGRIEVNDGAGSGHTAPAGHRRRDHCHQPPRRPGSHRGPAKAGAS
jgi:hypothetical protein